MSPDAVRILVVDDKPAKLVALTALLEEPGRIVVGALSGREALRRLLQDDFAVILLDVNMPDIDGFETAALIRQRASTQSTPIIFITADYDETHAGQGYSLGAVDYILAPVIPEVLRAKVAVFVDLYRKTQQIKEQMHQSLALVREQAARAAAEDSRRQSEFLAEASRILSASLHSEATIGDLARVMVPAVAQLALVTTLDRRGQPLVHALARPDAAAAETRRQFIAGADLPRALLRLVESAAASGSEVSAAGAQAAAIFAALDDSPARAAGGPAWQIDCIPLVARGSTLGVLTVGRTAESPAECELALLRDIASRAAIALDNARLYRDIQDSDRRKDEFLAMLGHELRNPLAAMSNALECLRLLDDNAEVVEESQDVLGRQLRQMTRLVDDLLDVSRITRGKVALRKELVELSPAVRGAVATMTPAMQTKHHEFAIALPVRPVFVSADPARLEQILANLLHNAVKYTPPRGHISLKAEIEDDWIAIHVKDDGVGIGPDLLPVLFELFVQGERSLDRSQGGLGIGLTLVRSLVELHGGQVTVFSQGVARGSEFVVRLPIAPSPSPVPAQTPEAPLAASASAGASWSWTTTWTWPTPRPPCSGPSAMKSGPPAAVSKPSSWRRTSLPTRCSSTSASRGSTVTKLPAVCGRSRRSNGPCSLP